MRMRNVQGSRERGREVESRAVRLPLKQISLKISGLRNMPKQTCWGYQTKWRPWLALGGNLCAPTTRGEGGTNRGRELNSSDPGCKHNQARDFTWKCLTAVDGKYSANSVKQTRKRLASQVEDVDKGSGGRRTGWLGADCAAVCAKRLCPSAL